MGRFTYNGKSYPCFHQGQWLDSLLELRFILSIEATHAWIRDGLEIFYTIDEVPEGIKGGLSSYTPDFLIRNFQTRKATLVEIKPTGYDNLWALQHRREIAENYINQFGYDWEYKILFGDQIILTNQAQQRFLQIVNDYQVGISHLPRNTYLYNSEAYRRYVKDAITPAEGTIYQHLL